MLLIFIVTMLYSGYRIFSWAKENNQNKKLQNNISEKIIINENISITDNEDIEKKYKIDFDALKQINEDVVGWIKVERTDIDYVVLQGKDNEFYLTHSFDKAYNSAGWIFADYTNRLDGLH